MKVIFLYLYYIAFLNNIKNILGIELSYVYPNSIRIKEQQNSEYIVSINLKFTESMKDETGNSILIMNNSNSEIKCKKSSNQSETDDSVVVYDFDKKDFVDSKKSLGKYNLYYGKDEILLKETVLIYENFENLKYPRDRYLLTENNRIGASFIFSEVILLDQINRITYLYNNINKTLSRDDYNLTNGRNLTIYMNPSNEIGIYTFSIYPERAKNTPNPIKFYIHYQDFFIYYEAVYSNEQSIRSLSYFKIKFKQNKYDPNKISIYAGDTSTSVQIVNFTSIDTNTYFCYFYIENSYKDELRIVYKEDNGEEQVRPIYLLKYEVTSNKCFFLGTEDEFTIKIGLEDELEKSIDYRFNLTNEEDFTYDEVERDKFEYRTPLSHLPVGIISLESSFIDLNPDIYYPVDDINLNIRIFKDPELTDNKTHTLYTNINENQNVYFYMKEAGNAKEILLKNNSKSDPIIINLTECSVNNNKNYTCNLSPKIKNLADDDLLEYDVYYISECDNQELPIKGKKIKIEKGYYLLRIGNKYSYKNKVNGKNLSLVYSNFIDPSIRDIIKIEFCNKENNNCTSQQIQYIIQNIIVIQLNDLNEGTYEIKTSINHQIIKNDTIIFKVLENGRFLFNHHYFTINNGTDPENNNLEITKVFYAPSICNITENSNNIQLTTDDCSIYIYKINTFSLTGILYFNYFDDELKDYIPIDDNITVENYISDLMDISSFYNCQYYIFSLNSSFINIETGVKIFFNINSHTQIEFERNNNEFYLNIQNIKSLIGNKYDLYISEKNIDTTVYLYKSFMSFTDIKVPEYIIRPNLILHFSKISCNLCNSTINIINEDGIDIQLSECSYSNEVMSLHATNSIYDKYANNTYSINNHNIINNSYENQANQVTFTSNTLYDSRFIVDIDESNDENLTIILNNTNKDFYFKLISNLTIYQKINGQNFPIILKRNNTEYNFKISDENYVLSFGLSKGNYILNISYLTREVDILENSEELGISIYHIFNNITDFTIFSVTPNIFAFHNINESFVFNISFISRDLMIRDWNEYYYKYNCTDDHYYENIITCRLFNIINETRAQIYKLNISNYFIDIYLIYYYLDPSLTCITWINQRMQRNLVISVPEPIPLRSIYLVELDPDNFNEESRTSTTRIQVRPTNTYNLYNNQNLLKTISFQDFGINFLNKYEFNEKGEKIMLFPKANQRIHITFKENNYKNESIAGFCLGNRNATDFIISGNYSNITFNLDSVSFSSDTNLSYIDACGEIFDTGIIIQIMTFSIKRHYFVIENNNNNQNKQILNITGPSSDDKNFLVMVDSSGIEENVRKYYKNGHYEIELSHQGNYTFYYNNNGIINYIEGTVYVYQSITDVFDINSTIDDCMFSDLEKKSLQDINFNLTFKGSNKSESIFDMSFKIDKDNVDYALTKAERTNSININYSLSFNDNIRNKVSFMKECLITFYENGDKEQPLYIFKFNYTNITLNENFAECIYSDAEYIEFNTFCNISNFANFDIINQNSNKASSVKCESSIINNKNNSDFYSLKCYLNESNSTINPFLNEYGYHRMSYLGYNMDKKRFYISKYISSNEYSFDFEKEVDIFTNSNTSINVSSSFDMFYMPNLVHLIYYNESGYKIQTLSFRGEFNRTNNYIPFQLYIGNKSNIINLSKLCTEECSYCRHNYSCKNISEIIKSNVPEINFKFSRHYISIENSLYNGNHDTRINIEIDGADQELLDKIYYKHYSQINRNPTTEHLDKSEDNKYIFNNTNFGFYEFYYRAINRSRNYTIQDKVFIVNHDYELFNFHDLNNDCLYYQDEIIYTKITLNENYIFKDKATNALNDLQLFLNTNAFTYTEKGYKLTLNTFRGCNGQDLSYQLIENKNFMYVFTELKNKKKCTEVTFINNPYKDNIILTDQYCALNNIYLKENNNNEDTEQPLICEYNETNKKSYCNIINKSFGKSSINFDILIKSGNQNSIETGKTINVYNSINNSSFVMTYINYTLSIQSHNFEMNNINYTIIDYNQSKTNFRTQSSNMISFNYVLPNDTDNHYITRIIRKDHQLDKEIENPIKYIDVRILIIEILCPEFFVGYAGDCYSCSHLSILPQFLGRPYYQERTCVSICNFEDGYAIFDSNHKYCKKCSPRTPQRDANNNLRYYCDCLVGTVQSYEDNICYLPEMSNITVLTNNQRNAQCYKSDGTTHNYCYGNNTISCTVESINGYIFPTCKCREGYTGKYCEFSESNISLAQNMSDILSDNFTLNERNTTMISKIRGITYFLEKDSNYIDTIIDQISTYVDSSIRLVEKILNGTSTVSQIFDVLELAIYFLNYKIKKNEALRNLQDQQDIRNLEYILDNLHYINVQANNIKNNQNFRVQTDQLNLTTFIAYKNTSLSDETFKKDVVGGLSYFKVMEYLDIKVDYDDFIFVTLINSSLFPNNEINEGDFGVKAYFSSSKDINMLNSTIQQQNNFPLYISSSILHFNFELAEYYNEKNIKIYDKADKAFVDPCFLSENFDFDLTQKYRKNYVYQKTYYGNDVCKYIGFEHDYNRIIFKCDNFSYFNKTYNLSYGALEFNFRKDTIENADKVHHLPTKCTSRIDSVGSNWAFWFYLIISLLEIAYCTGLVILNLGSVREVSYRKGLIQDELYRVIPYVGKDDEDKFYNNNEKISNSEGNDVTHPYYREKYIPPQEKENKKNKKKRKIINDNIINADNIPENIPFSYFLLNNIKELHPITSLCRVSIISPLIINSIFFVFNILTLFGFNALLYNESLIEKRIYNKNRNNFDYPMLKEFHKIIFSILCQIGLCLIAKLILLVTLDQRKQFENSLRNCSRIRGEKMNNDIQIKIKDFQDVMLIRRIISCGVMVLIIIFFFYYSIAFCAVYIKTQINWFYSGIWSLFWNWVIFAPIYIIIISAIQYKKQDIYSRSFVIYYMKRLFIF